MSCSEDTNGDFSSVCDQHLAQVHDGAVCTNALVNTMTQVVLVVILLDLDNCRVGGNVFGRLDGHCVRAGGSSFFDEKMERGEWVFVWEKEE